VLSLEQLTSQMLASSALKEDVLFEELNLRVRRCRPGDLSGETPRSSNIGKQYRVTVVGVERNDELRTEVGPDFTFQPEDVLYLAGSSEKVKKLTKTFDMHNVED
jgi:K+/H+ antiporter YhaU regulatory subunit KhtT